MVFYLVVPPSELVFGFNCPSFNPPLVPWKGLVDPFLWKKYPLILLNWLNCLYFPFFKMRGLPEKFVSFLLPNPYRSSWPSPIQTFNAWVASISSLNILNYNAFNPCFKSCLNPICQMLFNRDIIWGKRRDHVISSHTLV